MRRAIETIVAAALAAVLSWTSAQADEAAEEAALSLVRTMVEDSHQAMAANHTGALKEAISEGFAFDVWERFLIGERELAPEQRATFRELLPGFLANLYAERFGKELEAAPEVIDARPVRRDVLVKARIPRKGAEPLPVEYRVRDFEDRGPQVIDIMVGGVSFLVLKREEFGAVHDKGGTEALLDHMRENSI